MFSPDIVLNGVNDSKKLSSKKREILFDIIKKKALAVGIGVVHENKIDEVNILEATIIAMRLAIENLDISPDLLLVDGNMRNITNIPQKNIIKGDSKSLSIAAASIIAKVTRDRMMFQYDKVFPGYGLAKNMGYGTKLLHSLEKIVYKHGINKIFLNSRINAITFYQKNGYSKIKRVEPSFGDIIHYRMEKIL